MQKYNIDKFQLMDFRCKNNIKVICCYSDLLVWRFKYQINCRKRIPFNKNELGIGIVQIEECHFFKVKYNVGSGLKIDAVYCFDEIVIETNRVVWRT